MKNQPYVLMGIKIAVVLLGFVAFILFFSIEYNPPQPPFPINETARNGASTIIFLSDKQHCFDRPFVITSLSCDPDLFYVLFIQLDQFTIDEIKEMEFRTFVYANNPQIPVFQDYTLDLYDPPITGMVININLHPELCSADTIYVDIYGNDEIVAKGTHSLPTQFFIKKFFSNRYNNLTCR